MFNSTFIQRHGLFSDPAVSCNVDQGFLKVNIFGFFLTIFIQLVSSQTQLKVAVLLTGLEYLACWEFLIRQYSTNLFSDSAESSYVSQFPQKLGFLTASI